MTTKLITADEISQAWANIEADWPRERFQDLKRLICDTLHDCQQLAETYEDAARQRASPDHAKALHKLAASLICPPSLDDVEDEVQRARRAGAL